VLWAHRTAALSPEVSPVRARACTHKYSASNVASQDQGAWNDLLVIADATAQIADPGYEANLLCWGFVRTRPYKHVAKLSDVTFRLLKRVVEFLAKRLAVDVL
jgi:hypothetical protein